MRGTGTWFLERADYKKLRDGDFKESQGSGLDKSNAAPMNWRDRILVVQGMSHKTACL